MTNVDNILLGGMIANHVLQAQGVAVGKSKLDKEIVEETQKSKLDVHEDPSAG